MKSTVSIVRVCPRATTGEVVRAVHRAVALLGDAREMCPPGKHVLVKPNVGSTDVSNFTSPSVTFAVAKLFVEAGYRVLVGEDPSVPCEEQEVYAAYRMPQLARDAGAELVSLRHGPHQMVKVPAGRSFNEIEISSAAMEAGLVVTVPVTKLTNVGTIVSLSMKNLKGLIKPAWKRKFHVFGLDAGIVDLNAAVRAGLSVVDGTFVTDLTTGAMYPLGMIAAGRDLVAVDAVCSRVMGVDPLEIDYLRLASEAGLGRIASEDIDIVGDGLAGLEGLIRVPKPVDPFAIARESGGRLEIVTGSPCSTCLTTLGTELLGIRDSLKRIRPTVLLVGPTARPPKDSREIVAVGTCLEGLAKKGNLRYVAGCPPTSYEFTGTGNIAQTLLSLVEEGGPDR